MRLFIYYSRDYLEFKLPDYVSIEKYISKLVLESFRYRKEQKDETVSNERPRTREVG